MPKPLDFYERHQLSTFQPTHYRRRDGTHAELLCVIEDSPSEVVPDGKKAIYRIRYLDGGRTVVSTSKTSLDHFLIHFAEREGES